MLASLKFLTKTQWENIKEHVLVKKLNVNFLSINNNKFFTFRKECQYVVIYLIVL